MRSIQLNVCTLASMLFILTCIGMIGLPHQSYGQDSVNKPLADEKYKNEAPIKLEDLEEKVAKQRGPFRADSDGTAVAKLVLRGALPEGPFSGPFGGATDSPFERLLNRIEKIGRDPYYKGAIIELEHFSLSMDQLSQLDELLMLARAKYGKRIVFYAQQYDMMSYLLALSGDQIYLMEHGALQFSGLAIQEMYFAQLLSKLGMKADFVQVGEYKGAQEAMTRRGPSEAWSKNIDGCLDDIYELIVTKIKNRRKAFEKVDMKTIEARLGKAIAMKDVALVEAGFIDQVVDQQYQSILTDTTNHDALRDLFGSRYELEVNDYSRRVEVQAESPWEMFQAMMRPAIQTFNAPTIAVVHIRGPIVSGPSTSGGIMGGSTQTGSYTIQKLLKRLKASDQVKGVVLRIDSPGGSALASEVIWQSVMDLRTKTDFYPGKPVYASLGNTAASGGYYVAVSAEEIHATPASLIGSIGVVGGKISMGDLFEKIGVHVHVRSRGPMAQMFAGHRGFTIQERALFRKSTQKWYDYFKRRVEAGRGDRLKDFDKVARGRLFTGRQCVKNGLVDKRKTLRSTINQMVKTVKLTGQSYDIVHLPKAPSFMESLQATFGVQAPIENNGKMPEKLLFAAQAAGLDTDQLHRLWTIMSIVRHEQAALMSFVGTLK